MARCESRSNRASHSRDPAGYSPTAPTRPLSSAGGRRISVVVVDAGHAARNGAAARVAGPPIQVVGCAAPGSEAVALVERVRPDVVLVHGDPGRPIGPELIEALKAQYPLTRIVVVDAGPVAGTGGKDVLVSDESFVHVLASIQQAAAEGEGSAAGNGSVGVSRYGGPALTRREHEILRLVALGNTNNEIAQRLGLAANTVKTYWQRALHKLSARNRAEAIARAHDLHLI